MCGGTPSQVKRCLDPAGLSPRVRGNLQAIDEDGGKKWSIPACAGEPPFHSTVSGCGWVYPRVCGGTRRQSRHGDDHGGLSPRVRGNLRKAIENPIGIRSIPACAGEPTQGY